MNELFVFVTYICIWFGNAIIASYLQSFVHVTELNDKQCNISDKVFVALKPNIVLCAMDCLDHALCTGFTFDINNACTGCRETYGPESALVSGQTSNYFRGDWITFEGNAYKVSTEMMSFENGTDYCETFGAYLARVDSERESLFIRQQNWQYSRSFWVTCEINSNYFEAIWIGLTDEDLDGVWKWVHGGDETNFTDWNKDPPDVKPSGLANHDCVAIQQRFGYQWSDRTCFNQFNVLCEK